MIGPIIFTLCASLDQVRSNSHVSVDASGSVAPAASTTTHAQLRERESHITQTGMQTDDTERDDMHITEKGGAAVQLRDSGTTTTTASVMEGVASLVNYVHQRDGLSSAQIADLTKMDLATITEMVQDDTKTTIQDDTKMSGTTTATCTDCAPDTEPPCTSDACDTVKEQNRCDTEHYKGLCPKTCEVCPEGCAMDPAKDEDGRRLCVGCCKAHRKDGTCKKCKTKTVSGDKDLTQDKCESLGNMWCGGSGGR